MARTPKNHDAAISLGLHLTDLRARVVQPPSFERIGREIEVHFNVTMSAEQVRKFHVGEVDPHAAPLEQLVALAAYYDVGLSDLGPEAGARWNRTSDLLVQARPCTTTSPVSALSGVGR